MRKTKIICTIGPSSANPETLKAMCKAGMNVARLNFSHGTLEDHKKNIEMLKAVSSVVNVPVIASGGAGSSEHFVELFRKVPEVSAGLAASIFHFGEVKIPDLKAELSGAGVIVRK